MNRLSRRDFLRVATVLALAPAARRLEPPVYSQSADAWPQFRGNYNNTGVSPSQPPAELKLLWTYDAGDIIESSAAIADNTVYVGTGKSELIAVDLQTGKLKWGYKTKEAVGESSPAVGGGMVFVGDLLGVFHTVSAGNGQGVWTYKTDGEIKSSPVIVGDRVLIGSYDGSLYCFNTRDGKTMWRFKTDNYVHCTPTVANDIAYIAGCDEVFRGIRISDGREVLRMPGIGNTASSPAHAGNSVYFGNFSNEVLSLNLRTRRRAWLYTHPQRHHRPRHLDIHHARASRIVTGHRRRASLRRLQRWALFRSGFGEGNQAVGIQCGRRGFRVTGDCERARGDRRS